MSNNHHDSSLEYPNSSGPNFGGPNVGGPNVGGPNVGGPITSTVRKGLLWVQRDKLFSRWKERYFVLTREYLNCFKKGTSRLSEMGEFLYKVKLCDIDEVDILDKRGYLTVCLSLSSREGKIYLRKTDGIREWHRNIKSCHEDALDCARLRSPDTESFWSRKQVTDSTSIDNWMQSRKKKALLSSSSRLHSGSTPDVNNVAAPAQRDGEITLNELSKLYLQCERDADDAAPAAPVPVPSSVSPVRMRNRDGGARKPKIINRLSLMSDIELPDFGQHHRQQHQQPPPPPFKGSPSPASDAMKRGSTVVSGTMTGTNSHHSNDSGNHSMSTNASLASSASSKSKDSSSPDIEEEVAVGDGLHEIAAASSPRHHRTVIEVRHRAEQQQNRGCSPSTRAASSSRAPRASSCESRQQRHQQKRRSSYAPTTPGGMQVTHV